MLRYGRSGERELCDVRESWFLRRCGVKGSLGNPNPPTFRRGGECATLELISLNVYPPSSFETETVVGLKGDRLIHTCKNSSSLGFVSYLLFGGIYIRFFWWVW